ncbi:alpha/beta fold hydrolase [Emticicia sp. 17c]|uniref:alpha/beta fold hydrolase n=1 Tax=Emticicia sp. 17c TaxID=3127704 RepID=UPI00301BD185
MKFVLLLLVTLTNAQILVAQTFQVKLDTVTWFDKARNRPVPIAFYTPVSKTKVKHQKVVIFNHGYGENLGGANLAYSYLNNYLASEGYFVASIQHELPTDSLLPTTGKPQIVRRSNWERGAASILFTLNELKKRYPDLDYKQLILIGHSNGGDMAALFAHKYPDLISKLITLDNRRMALPRTAKPVIYSIRSSDQPADENVLPTPEEQKKYGITLIKLPDTIHNDMDDSGNERQRTEITGYVRSFLRK